MKKASLVLFMFVICTLLFLSSSVLATSCLSCPLVEQGPPCKEYWKADAVFVGLAAEVTTVDWPPERGAWSPYLKLTVRFSVEEPFRGVNSTELTMAMGSCAYQFKQGERYLVYAHRDREGKLSVETGRSRTQPLSEAGEDLEYIRRLPQASPGGRIFGTVIRYTTTMDEKGYESKPMVGVKVTLEGADQHYEGATDSTGKYELTGIPAGAYRIHALVPKHFNGDRHEIKVQDRGCTPVNFSIESTGSIAGRVLDAKGRPVDGAAVSILAAEGVSEEALAGNRGAWSYTNQLGRYSFDRLPAGQYLIIVIGDVAANEYPRTFYPGVSDLSQATVISLSEGQKKLNQDVRLLPQ